MRKKKLWNTVMSSLLAGLMLVNAPLSALATDVSAESYVLEEPADVIAEEFVEEPDAMVVEEEDLSLEMVQSEPVSEDGLADAQTKETEGAFSIEGVEVVGGSAADAAPDTDMALTVQNGEEAVTVETYTVTFALVSAADKQAIKDAVVNISYEDDWGDVISLEQNKDGSYSMDPYTSYTYNITAAGYKEVSGTFTPSGEASVFTKTIEMMPDVEVDPVDQAKVDAVKKEFDKTLGALRPDYSTDKNIITFVQDKLKGYAFDTSGVTVSLKETDDMAYISGDGTILYNKGTLNTYGNNTKNVRCTFVFRCNSAESVSAATTVTVGWDREYFKGKMQEEADTLTEETIKGNNTSLAEVTADLTLPQITGTKAFDAWSKITWESSDPSVISVEATGYDGVTDPKKGKVIQPEKDTQVTLTASFHANDSVLNSNVEAVDDFGVIQKTFTVTVKGNGQSAPDEKDLLAILDKYYPNDLLLAYGTEAPVDLNNCQSDIQLPRYTRIKDEKGKLVFANKEITVTSDNPIITINGYRASVDLFHDNDTTVNLTISFTREGVTVKREVPVMVRMISDAALDAELKKMETAKAHYFDGLNDGVYADKDSITGNLHTFIEMTVDESGAPVWIYDRAQATGEGIIADDMFDDPWEMESAGYNHFKSSQPAILKHENLVLAQQPQTDTQVTITSMLSSEKYGKFAKDHPENEKLQKLYRQEVSVTVTVKGTQNDADALAKQIKEAQALLALMTEGEKPGEYPAGTKAKLEAAIAQAQSVLDAEGATAQQYKEALQTLQGVVDECRASVIARTASVRVVLSNTDGLETQLPPTLAVSAGAAAKYGYSKDADLEKEVTVLDALAAIHAEIFGEDYAAAPTAYLNVNDSGWITTIFGEETNAVGFMVNHKMPLEGGVGATCSRAVLNSADQLNVFLYKDLIGYSDRYLYFDAIPEVKAGETVSLKVFSPDMMGTGEPKAESFVSIEVKDPKGVVSQLQTDMNGAAEFTPEMAGTYTLKITGSLMWTDIIAADGEKTVEVLSGEEQVKGAKVSFTLMGDHEHNSNQDGIVHTLAAGNLETWVPETIYYMDPDATVHDVLVKAAEEYGFTILSRGSEYDIYIEGIEWKEQSLKEFDNGPKSGWMFTVNGVHPDLGVGMMNVKDGDRVVFHYTDDYTKEESQMFDKQQAEAVEEFIASIPAVDKLTEADRETVETARAMYDALTDAQKALVCAEALQKLKEAEAALAGMQHIHTWDTGKVTKPATCTADGVKTYTCTSCGQTKTENIKAAGHQFGAWKKTSDATVFAAEKQTRTCSVCKAQETRESGSKLKPTMKVTANKITLKVKQSTKGFKVTGLANGDSVKSYKSSNTKIFRVSKNGKITAGKKTGKAKLTITLESGLKKKVTVKVQKSDVRTTKIEGLDKKLTLAKGKKTTLRPQVKPFTSKQKITYASSNKKIVTVNSRGVVKAVKPGKAKITVKSGSKKFVVTVKVTKK